MKRVIGYIQTDTKCKSRYLMDKWGCCRDKKKAVALEAVLDGYDIDDIEFIVDEFDSKKGLRQIERALKADELEAVYMYSIRHAHPRTLNVIKLIRKLEAGGVMVAEASGNYRSDSEIEKAWLELTEILIGIP